MTTVSQPIAEIGRLATELVIRRSQQRNAPPEGHGLQTRLVVRKSACARAHGAVISEVA